MDPTRSGNRSAAFEIGRNDGLWRLHCTAWLGSLIELLAPFGISDRLVRTSIFRLAEEGWLEARREGRRSLYTLTASELRRFELAYRRIYAPPNLTWQGN